jgi:hypothetical protein
MADTGVKLVDDVLPAVLYRQWVLSFPIPLRLLFAHRPELLFRILAMVARALPSAVLGRAAQRRSDAETGVVASARRRTASLLRRERKASKTSCWKSWSGGRAIGLLTYSSGSCRAWAVDANAGDGLIVHPFD